MHENPPLTNLIHRIGIATLILLATTLGGCANKPIVDMKGVSRAQYEQDLAECGEYADQVEVGKKAVGGAAAGAAVGAAIGAIWNDSVGKSAATGAVLGGAGGTGHGAEERDRVVKNCLRGRGYKVLN
jgi:hypothetical protein